jgi:hypothetical protein
MGTVTPVSNTGVKVPFGPKPQVLSAPGMGRTFSDMNPETPKGIGSKSAVPD